MTSLEQKSLARGTTTGDALPRSLREVVRLNIAQIGIVHHCTYSTCAVCQGFDPVLPALASGQTDSCMWAQDGDLGSDSRWGPGSTSWADIQLSSCTY